MLAKVAKFCKQLLEQWWEHLEISSNYTQYCDKVEDGALGALLDMPLGKPAY